MLAHSHVESSARDDVLARVCSRALENTDPTLESIGTYLKDAVFFSSECPPPVIRSDKPININTLSLFLSDHHSTFPQVNTAHD